MNKEEKPNYPESLVGSVWESNEFAANSGSGAMRFEFYNTNACRVIIKTEKGEIRFETSSYSYNSGIGIIFILEPWSIKLKTGEVFSQQQFQDMKNQLLKAGNFTLYYQFVDAENQMKSISGSSFKFSVEGNVLKEEGGSTQLNRK